MQWGYDNSYLVSSCFWLQIERKLRVVTCCHHSEEPSCPIANASWWTLPRWSWNIQRRSLPFLLQWQAILVALTSSPLERHFPGRCTHCTATWWNTYTKMYWICRNVALLHHIEPALWAAGLMEPPRKVKNKKSQKEGVPDRLPMNFAPSANLKKILMGEGSEGQRRMWAFEEPHLMREMDLEDEVFGSLWFDLWWFLFSLLFSSDSHCDFVLMFSLVQLECYVLILIWWGHQALSKAEWQPKGCIGQCSWKHFDADPRTSRCWIFQNFRFIDSNLFPFFSSLMEFTCHFVSFTKDQHLQAMHIQFIWGKSFLDTLASWSSFYTTTQPLKFIVWQSLSPLVFVFLQTPPIVPWQYLKWSAAPTWNDWDHLTRWATSESFNKTETGLASLSQAQERLRLVSRSCGIGHCASNLTTRTPEPRNNLERAEPTEGFEGFEGHTEGFWSFRWSFWRSRCAVRNPGHQWFQHCSGQFGRGLTERRRQSGACLGQSLGMDQWCQWHDFCMYILLQLVITTCYYNLLLVYSRKLALLAGVPLALARNMPGAGPADLLILSMFTPPPRRLVTLRSWVQPPLRPSSQKQSYLQCFLHYRAVKPR